ncbi:hypothetical protein L1987_12762 [Smallanthus sonchifolius]|uniref:Uncharacterized protein n=1 Tax=Smallanthus sonchifolius TaxID=185202 RepID=A0ACB9JF78_9ASTR|nr:hypothetical protein L1987_12762 [Smallanthus sonchifolius]
MELIQILDYGMDKFYEHLSSKARLKPMSPPQYAYEENLGQRLQAKLLAAQQKSDPSELQMELSIAVNTSFGYTSMRGFYHVFSHIIILQEDICTFGKTGTLTSADMEFSRVGGLSDDIDLETNTKKIPTCTLENLPSCHAPVFVDHKLVGDPLERVAIKGIEWTYKSDVKVMPKK